MTPKNITDWALTDSKARQNGQMARAATDSKAVQNERNVAEAGQMARNVTESGQMVRTATDSKAGQKERNVAEAGQSAQNKPKLIGLLKYYQNLVNESQKSVILCHINDKKLTRLERKCNKSSSPVWSQFKIVCYENVSLDCVICDQCDSIFKYTATSGNKAMLNHMKKCISDHPKLNQYFKTDKKLEPKDSQLVKEAQVRFTACTLSSFNINENTDFYHFADTMIDIGSRYGKVEAKKILFGRKTISKSTYDEANNFKVFLFAHLKSEKIIQNSAYCLMSDIWSSRHTKTSYLQIHVQFINSE